MVVAATLMLAQHPVRVKEQTFLGGAHKVKISKQRCEALSFPHPVGRHAGLAVRWRDTRAKLSSVPGP